MRDRPSIALPLSKLSRIPGDAGAGPSAPGFLVTDDGVLINRRGRLSLHTSDLSSELWRVSVEGWSGKTLVAGDAVYFGVAEKKVREFSLREGSVLRSFSYDGGSIAALERDCCILLRSKYVEAINWEGQRLWSVEIDPGGLEAHAGGRLYASAIDPLCRAVVCINASEGDVEWKQDLPAEGRGDAAMLSHKISSISVVGERVLVIPQDGRRLFALARSSGEIESVNRLPSLPSRGQYLVTEREVISFHPYVISFFDHTEMRETKRLDLRNDVEPLYGGRPPFSYGVCLTQDSAIWTAPHGAFMGINLEPGPDGHRTTWLEEIPGALIPRGIPPVVHNGYMYYTNMGESLELMCYASAASPR